jgi:hypothetical protein
MALTIACKLDPTGLAERRQLLERLVSRAVERRELDEGYAFVFPPGVVTLAELAQVIDSERCCCPFLRFVIDVQPAGGPVSLSLTGPDGTKAFLRGLFIVR